MKQAECKKERRITFHQKERWKKEYIEIIYHLWRIKKYWLHWKKKRDVKIKENHKTKKYKEIV